MSQVTAYECDRCHKLFGFMDIVRIQNGTIEIGLGLVNERVCGGPLGPALTVKINPMNVDLCSKCHCELKDNIIDNLRGVTGT